MIVARHLRIHGRVQGVFYRAWTVETARRLGVAGWVRNRDDGSVEALVQGDAGQVRRLVELAQDGPPRAVVEGVRSTEAAVDESLNAFEQRPTA